MFSKTPVSSPFLVLRKALYFLDELQKLNLYLLTYLSAQNFEAGRKFAFLFLPYILPICYNFSGLVGLFQSFAIFYIILRLYMLQAMQN